MKSKKGLKIVYFNYRKKKFKEKRPDEKSA